MKIATKLAVALCSVLVPALIAGCGGGNSVKPKITAKPRSDGEKAPQNGGGATNGKQVVAEGFGTFKGVVKYDGTPPVMGILNAQKDPICFANQDQIKDQSLLVNNGNNGIQNVFVYLSRAPAGAQVEPAPEDPIAFDQKFCTFLPHGMVVRTGRTLLVLNDDNTTHNTHTFPNSPRNRPFNQSVSPNDREGLPTEFAAAERLPVAVKCDIHAWMSAYILPLDHDFGAVTDENGAFEIPNLPAGEHEFVIWHERGQRLESKFSVTIQADQTTEETLTFAADRFQQ